MINWKLGVRKATTGSLRLMPTPVVRHFLKSYFYNQDLQNRLRYHIQPFRYDCPIPDVTEIDVARLTTRRQLAGFPADMAVFYPWIDKLKPFAAETHGFPQQADGKALYWYRNGAYEDFDGVTLYSMIRLLKPKRMIEAGCGYSTRMTTLAVAKNTAEGAKPECLFVEPYPPPYLLNVQLPGPLRAEQIQKVPLEEFAKLKSGDILFIDTSHVLKTQSDLCYIFHVIMPALASGVYIHFHDIFTPFDYPEYWLLKIAFHYNEQYVLEAVLANSAQYEVILPVHGLWREHFKKLSELLPAGQLPPAAFWIRKK